MDAIFTMIIVVAFYFFIFIGFNVLKKYSKKFIKFLDEPNSKQKNRYQHKQRFSPNAPFDKKLAYCLMESLLTNREADFYHMLKYVLKDSQYIIAIKPRMADFIKVNLNQYKDPYVFWHCFNKISAKHVDFLILDKVLKPVLAVELDDTTHGKADRVQRDEFVDSVYNAVGLNVIHIYDYSLEYLKSVLYEFLTLENVIPSLTSPYSTPIL